MEKLALFLLIALIGGSECCIHCNSSEDVQCINPETFLSRKCENTSACYTRVVGGHTVRGCLIDLEESVKKDCLDPTSTSCVTCNNSNDCNKNVFPPHRLQCHQCNGTQTSECAVERLGGATVCRIYKADDTCFIYSKNSTNKFVRGCLSDANLNLCDDRDDCFVCDGHGCNLLAFGNKQIPNARGEGNTITSSVSIYAFVVATVLVNILK